MKSRKIRKSRSEEALAARPDPSESSTKPFCIVGVGASAGGLEAFTKLLEYLPTDTGMGFVLVQHLDPAHESALTQLLTRATSMPVREIIHNLTVKPDQVYIIPPNANLSIARGVLKLHPRQPSGKGQRSIDLFFESLAQDQRQRAVGVVLSGTASDGTLGLEAIKAEGGITIAQDESAKYDSMPRGAIAAGCVDFVLSPENIAKELVRIAKHPYVAGHSRRPQQRGQRQEVGKPVALSEKEGGLKKVLLLLRNHSGADFSLYKGSTIQRRIGRRMVLNKLHTFEAYAGFLRGNPKELDALYADVLISVTDFFRNPQSFEVLQQKVFPKLCQGRRDDPLRVWAPGCSTGQEAYSIAMSFVEFSDRIPRVPKLQVFATDLNEAVLDKARQGLYPKPLLAEVSPERLRRFFAEEQGGYRVRKALREVVVFARQNLLSDPPFSRLDLISCRNLLIYLEPELQKKLLPAFHYALKPGGFLFLGASESIGGFGDLFEARDKTHKIYSRKPGLSPAFRLPIPQTHPWADLPLAASRPVEGSLGAGSPGGHAGLNAPREAERLLLDRFAPAGVLINAELQVLQFHGSTGPYLEPPTGTASFNLLKMARAGLMLPLRAAIAKARKENKVTRREGVRVTQNGGTRTVNLEVIPLKNLRERCFLVLFEKERSSAQRSPREAEGSSRAPLPASRVAGAGSPAPARRIGELERELAETRDYLQALQEQQAAANEELQASSEEAQSANEELQSINEELETSKEELESTNEELATVNDEMGSRNLELTRLNNDLNNLQVSIHTAVLLLGRDLSIRRFTPQAEKAFNLRATDVGRPLGDLKCELVFPEAGRVRDGAPRSADSSLELEALVRETVDTLSERERELRDKDGRWYLLRARPYMTFDNKIDGAVLVLVDIDALKRSEQEIKEARDFKAILEAASPLLILNEELRVKAVNESFCRLFQVTRAETEHRLVFDLGRGQWNLPKLRTFIEEIIPRNGFFDNFEVEHTFEQVGRRTMLVSGRQLDRGQEKLIVLTIHDITDVRRSEAALVQREQQLSALIRQANAGIAETDPTGRFVKVNEKLCEILGRSEEELLKLRDRDIIHPEDWPRNQPLLDALFAGGPDFDLEKRYLRPDGTVVWVRNAVCKMMDSSGRVVGALRVTLDMTERKQAEEALRESEERLRAVVETAVDGIITIDEGGVVGSVNPAAERVFGYAASEIVGQNVKMLMPEPYRAEHDSYLANYLETGQRKIIGIGREVRGRRKDGTTFPLDLAVSEMRLGGRRVFTGIVRDITKRREAEQALAEAQEKLRQHAGDLEVQVRERTVKLTELVGELEAFSYSITHDMRAPLRAMAGFAELLAGECAPHVNPQGQEYIRLITSAARRMDRLIQDSLNYSLITKTELKLEPVPLELLLLGILESYPAFQRPGAEIQMEGEFPAVLANEAALTQCISNLLGNAVKFVAPGVTPRVRVWAELVKTSNVQSQDPTSSPVNPSLHGSAPRPPVVRLFFQDNGIGIEPEMHERIFGIFQRLNKEFEGTGIGLAIAKKAAERMGGRLGLQSDPGRGSTFWLELQPAPEWDLA